MIINLFSTNDGSGWFNLKCIHASMKIILLIEIDIFVKFIIIFHSVNPDTKNKKSFLWVDIFYEKKIKILKFRENLFIFDDQLLIKLIHSYNN